MTKRIYSLIETLEQLKWHKERVDVLQARIWNGECTEETELPTKEQLDDLEDFIVGEITRLPRKRTEMPPGATISPPPYPPYGLDKQIDPRASSEENA